MSTAPQQSIVTSLRQSMAKMEDQLAYALPKHVKPERFIRIVMTAVQQNPDLQKCRLDSLLGACMKCAQDGLLPDGREAFLGCYFSKRDGAFIASYQPMIAGILKKIRQSGELKQLSCMAVREGDEFTHCLDENGEHFRHVTAEDNEDARIIYVYAAAWTKDGGFYFRKMTRGQVEKARAVSRSAEKGPWVDWWEEMAMKTVIRNLSKRLPMSAEIESVIQRVDDLYEDTRHATVHPATGVGALKERLSASISEPIPTESNPTPAALTFDQSTGEVLGGDERQIAETQPA